MTNVAVCICKPPAWVTHTNNEQWICTQPSSSVPSRFRQPGGAGAEPPARTRAAASTWVAYQHTARAQRNQVEVSTSDHGTEAAAVLHVSAAGAMYEAQRPRRPEKADEHTTLSLFSRPGRIFSADGRLLHAVAQHNSTTFATPPRPSSNLQLDKRALLHGEIDRERRDRESCCRISSPRLLSLLLGGIQQCETRGRSQTW